MSRSLLVIAVLFLNGVGCAAQPKRDVQGLRVDLAANPKDRQAARELARRSLQAGQRGEALQLFERLARVDALSARDIGDYQELLRARAQERLAIGDADAISDLRASGLAPSPESTALAALSYLRHSSRFKQDRAAALLKALPKGDVRRFAERPAQVDTQGQAQLVQWLADGGAKRQALRVARVYVDAGGRDPVVLKKWLELHRWWFGERFPALPSDAAELVEDPPRSLEGRPLSLRGTEANGNLAESWGAASWRDALAGIEAAFHKDPALAERLARRFIESSVYGARERAIVSELFFRLGDPMRARDIAVELAGLSGRMPPFDLAAGLATAATGEVDAAELYFTSAAAGSGDAGETWAIAASAYRGLGEHLAAVAAARKALSLTAKGNDLAILLDLIASQRALGRSEDAAASEAALLDRVPQAQRARAEELIRQDGERPPLASLLGPLRASLGFAAAPSPPR